MALREIIILLVVGGLAGFVAAKIWHGRGLGVAVNVLVGMFGAILGGFVFGLLGFALSGVVGTFVKAAVGAVILLALASLITRRRVAT